MNHLYYKEYYDLERNHWWFVARERIITSYIKNLAQHNRLKKENLRILNIGCGTGRSSEFLAQFGHVISIEYNEFCCEFAAQKTGLEIINASITEIPFPNASFDLVCAFDVIEHVKEDLLAVTEMKRVAKSNGILLITVPAFMSLWSHHDLINHHVKRYKLSQLEELFCHQQDGTPLFSTYFNFILFTPIFIFRSISNLLKSAKNRKGSGSDFEVLKLPLLNTLLCHIMSIEHRMVSKNIKFPFGVSALYSWKKH